MENAADLIIPIVLAGGKGTRLWPMSRTARPKQFLALTGDMSLFQQTLLRVSDPTRYAPAIVITNEDYRFLVAEQALECGVDLGAIILEPVARNTAPAIAAACFVAMSAGAQHLVHVLPADHEVRVDEVYNACLVTAIGAAWEGRLVTFGIPPTEPASGFGYIEADASNGHGARDITRFVEKPDADRAMEMLALGNYYWNSGMFVFAADRFLGECQQLASEVYEAAKAATNAARHDLDFIRLDKAAFAAAPDISVDHAIFEKTDCAAMVPSPFYWSDLGSWDAVWRVGACDAEENLQRGPVTLRNTKRSLVVSEKLYVVVDGLDDVAVIASEDAVYLGRLSEAQKVGGLVAGLKVNPATTALTEEHLTSYRPWGGYTSILNGERFQVKRLSVKPGKRLSLQKHHHRSEHWVVVRGTAEVQLGCVTMMLRENESIYIPQGEQHRLSNPGKITLELIEVQTGSYLGEDDIIRFADEFGRA